MRVLAFKRLYREDGGSAHGASSYVSYLNRIDRLCGGLDLRLAAIGGAELLAWAERQPDSAFDGKRNRLNSLSALRKYEGYDTDGRLGVGEPGVGRSDVPVMPPAATTDAAAVRTLLRDVKVLAARYYRLTGKPLGVTGEVAEMEAADTLGLHLSDARTPGYDAIEWRDGQARRVQIKGRAVDRTAPYRGRCPSIRCGDRFDSVILVLLDRETLEPIEMWEADEASVVARLAAPGSRARNERGSLGISQFRSIAGRRWSAEAGAEDDRYG